VFPQIRPEARDLVERHRSTGWEVAMVTGTHAFVAAPIAQAFGIHHLLAVQPEESGGRFTGRYVGTHTYQEGKVRAVRQWLADRQLTLEQCDDSTFFSDSINDLPLLEHVRHPVVTNGDERLRAIARQRGWPLLDLFDVARAA
jgi:HAD superfamily hydrolase (TIGR01490 family)